MVITMGKTNVISNRTKYIPERCPLILTSVLSGIKTYTRRARTV